MVSGVGGDFSQTRLIRCWQLSWHQTVVVKWLTTWTHTDDSVVVPDMSEDNWR